jgi:predicted CoA-substrate-specific enzyme activase
MAEQQKKQEGYLAYDVGSTTTKAVVISKEKKLLSSAYIRNNRQPIKAIQEATKAVRADVGDDFNVLGVGTTGSGRYLAKSIIDADFVIDELTAHAKASLYEFERLQKLGKIEKERELGNLIDIGGEDYKAVEFQNGRPIKSVMNSRCAAGTGGFLDYQAAELGISVEKFGGLALKSKHPVHIASRCTVFARTDIISKQTEGHRLEDIVAGLCKGLVRNYLAGVGKTVQFHKTIMFQGGVAANKGMVQAFQNHFGEDAKIIVPDRYGVMGAMGVGILTIEEFESNPKQTNFVGWDIPETIFETRPFRCTDCPNQCNVVELYKDGQLAARWGSKCGKWHDISIKRPKETATPIIEKEPLPCETCLQEEATVAKN